MLLYLNRECGGCNSSVAQYWKLHKPEKSACWFLHCQNVWDDLGQLATNIVFSSRSQFYFIFPQGTNPSTDSTNNPDQASCRIWKWIINTVPNLRSSVRERKVCSCFKYYINACDSNCLWEALTPQGGSEVKPEGDHMYNGESKAWEPASTQPPPAEDSPPTPPPAPHHWVQTLECWEEQLCLSLSFSERWMAMLLWWVTGNAMESGEEWPWGVPLCVMALGEESKSSNGLLSLNQAASWISTLSINPSLPPALLRVGWTLVCLSEAVLQPFAELAQQLLGASTVVTDGLRERHPCWDRNRDLLPLRWPTLGHIHSTTHGHPERKALRRVRVTRKFLL